MMVFLKMQGESVWNLVEYGWGPPLILDAQGRSIGELKPKHEWDKANNEGSEENDSDCDSDSGDDEFTDEQKLRNDKSKCQVVLNALKVKSSSKWCLDSGCSRHMIGDKSSFTSLENYDGGVVTFGDGNLAKMKGKDSIVLHGCPKLDQVLCVEGLKENLLSISQMCNKDHKRKVVIIGHRTVDNFYAIKPNSRTPLMCSKAKLDFVEF
ncbi:hypothetical protein AAG906_019372 [Vitis piasezkii]